MDSVTTSVHYARHLEVASRGELAPASMVTPVEANRSQSPPAWRRQLAVVHRLLRHPFVLVVVGGTILEVVRIILERMLE